MAVTIVNVNNTTFSINGIEYLKNFMSIVNGDLVKILNVYDSKVVLQQPTDYADYTVDGGGFASAILLQSALKDVLFNRDNLGTDLGYHIINNISDFNDLITGATPGVWLFLANITLDANKTIPAGVTFEFRDTQINLNTFTITGTSTFLEAGIEQIFDTNGNFAGTWKNTSYIVEWFGAINDDSTDNTLILNKILGFFDNVDIIFNGGVYQTQTLINANKLHLTGSGTIKAKENITNHIFLPSAEIKISGLTLDGNKANQVSSFDLITSVHKMDIINCIGKNSKRYGFRNVGGDKSLVSGCSFSGNDNDCIHFKNVIDGVITGNFSDLTNTGHIIELLDDCVGNRITDNILRSNFATKFGIEIWSNTTNGLRNFVSGNSIYGNLVGGGISISRAHECVVQSNNIYECISVGSIEIAQGGSDNIISDNIIKDSYRIVCSGTGPLICSRNKIINNKIINPIKSGVSGGQGIYLLFADDTEVSGNDIYNAPIHALQVENSTGNIIRNNTLVDGLLSAIYLNNVNKCIVQNNYASGFTTGGRYYFQIVGTNTDIVIQNNQGNNNSAALSTFTDVSENSNAWEIDDPISGTITLTAGTTSTVSNKNITTKSRVLLVPSNAAASGITGIYISARTSKVSFQITHSTAAGTETFDYTIL